MLARVGVLGLATWGVVAILAVLRAYDSFAYLLTFELSWGVFALVFALFVMWCVLTAKALFQRRFPWSPVLIAAAFALVVLNPARPALHAWGFGLAKPRLEAALASNECPAWAGPYRIKRCTSIGGDTWFVLEATGGLSSIDGLVKPRSKDFRPDGISYPEGDGWYFVSLGF